MTEKEKSKKTHSSKIEKAKNPKCQGEKFKRGGRPKLDESEVLDKNISVWFNSHDKKKLMDGVKKMDISFQYYCRSVLLIGIDRLIENQNFLKMSYLNFQLRKIYSKVHRMANRIDHDCNNGFTKQELEILGSLDKCIIDAIKHISQIYSNNVDRLLRDCGKMKIEKIKKKK